MPFNQSNRNQFINMAANQRVRTAIKAAYPNVMTAYTTVTQTVNNSATLVNEVELFFPVTANVFYYLEGMLNLTIAAAANNIQIDFGGNGTAGSTATTAAATNVSGNVSFSATGTATTLSVDATALNTALSGGTTTAWTKAILNFGFLCTASGVIAIRFAQVAAAATNTSILAGSFITATPLDPMPVQG